MLDDPGALGLGDLARPVGRRGVDDEDLVEERHPAHHLADRPPDDRADRLLLVERRQDEADRQALLLLELDEPAQVGELGVVEVRLAEPALDPGGDGARLLGGAVGGGERLGPRRELLERLAADRLAGLDDDDGRLGPGRDRLGQRAEQVGRRRRSPAGWADAPMTTRSACSASRRIALRTFAASRTSASALPLDVLPDELGERVLGLGADGERDPRRDEVEDRDLGVVAPGDRVGEAEGELGVGAAADRDDDPPDLLEPRCLTTAMSHGESRTTSSIVGENTDGPVAVAAGRRLAAPAEDDEVGLLLGRRLDDALGGVPADPDDRVDRRALGREVEDALEEPAGVAGARRALGERHALGHLDDAERGQLAGPRVEQVGAEPDQLLRRRRVRDRDEDPGGQRRDGSVTPAPSARPRRGLPALDEVRLEQLELAGLALDALLGLVGRDVAVLDDEAADPPEVDRHERGDERLDRRVRPIARAMTRS